MEYKNIFKFDIKPTLESMSLLALLSILPNFFGIINIATPFGFKIHFFQYLVFLAAIIYGPIGGLISGAFGSVFTAVTLNNPYIIVGNMILGFFVGFFVRLKWNIILAVLMAYLIQLPWLYYSDIYLAHMPVKVVHGVIIALFVSNIIWGAVAGWSSRYVKGLAS